MTSIPLPRRAEHLGSLLRPSEVLDVSSKDTDAAVRRQVEDRAIEEIVNEQVQLGLRAVSDGEYRRSRTTTSSPVRGTHQY